MLKFTPAVSIAIACTIALLTLPATAQRLRDLTFMVDRIYERLPDLPRENNYVSLTGRSAPESTWVKRLFLYHIRTQGRLPTNRFDWRLTFADYLGANVPMYASQYPGADSFLTNPLSGDRDRFQALSRQDRNRLLATILDIYESPDIINPLQLAVTGATTAAIDTSAGSTPIEDESNEGPAEERSPTRTLEVVEPGGAELLRPR
ncbi:hypothetical protein [Synechococcus sp. PCC 7336]|uniref:hypothetical protein n=1 Tax=Synechococcus sp. PCC 7336 TaxID=195250 RepID=UPI000684EC19|nr:hypothetical protein [Synechococcus sp. PCC 7336]